jgi:hypothetical protein
VGRADRGRLCGNGVWNGTEGNVNQSNGAFDAFGNRFVDPRYVDPAHYDFRLFAASPCLGKGPAVAIL